MSHQHSARFGTAGSAIAQVYEALDQASMYPLQDTFQDYVQQFASQLHELARKQNQRAPNRMYELGFTGKLWHGAAADHQPQNK